jgi:hypothetical protein
MIPQLWHSHRKDEAKNRQQAGQNSSLFQLYRAADQYILWDAIPKGIHRQAEQPRFSVLPRINSSYGLPLKMDRPILSPLHRAELSRYEDVISRVKFESGYNLSRATLRSKKVKLILAQCSKNGNNPQFREGPENAHFASLPINQKLLISAAYYI